jgi:hypothetical protein
MLPMFRGIRRSKAPGAVRIAYGHDTTINPVSLGAVPGDMIVIVAPIYTSITAPSGGLNTTGSISNHFSQATMLVWKIMNSTDCAGTFTGGDMIYAIYRGVTNLSKIAYNFVYDATHAITSLTLGAVATAAKHAGLLFVTSSAQDSAERNVVTSPTGAASLAGSQFDYMNIHGDPNYVCHHDMMDRLYPANPKYNGTTPFISAWSSDGGFDHNLAVFELLF